MPRPLVSALPIFRDRGNRGDVWSNKKAGVGQITVPVQREDGIYVRRGNPIIMPASARHKIIKEKTNLGCRGLLNNHPDLIYPFDSRANGFYVDIDTQDAFHDITGHKPDLRMIASWQERLMELADEITIPAPLDKVYEGLNDIAILKACIPGCETLKRTNENELEAKVTLKIGPVKAKFSGKVTLDTTKAPTGFSLAGAGDGGLAGFAKGGADVELIADGDTTLLKYVAKAETGGKIAQLGGRLITSTARKLSKIFFTKFEKIMSGEESLPEEDDAGETAPSDPVSAWSAVSPLAPDEAMLNPQDTTGYLFTMTNRNPSKALCRAKTRSGTPCKRIGNPINGRCHLHGGKSTGPRTEEGRARIAAAQFKHGNRSKAFIAAQRAKAARGRAIRAELATLEAEAIREGLLPSKWRDAYRV